MSPAQMADWMARRKKANRQESVPTWALTYGDLMSLLLVFFVLLASYSSLDVVKYRSMVGSFQTAFGRKDRTVDESTDEAPTLGSSVEEQERERQKVESQLSAIAQEVGGPFEIAQTDEGTRLRIDGTALFDSGSADLRPDASQLIARLAPVLRRYPHEIRVEGHTDDVPIATAAFPSNWELSAARAGRIVRAFLDSGGFSPSALAAIGYADTRPVASNTSAVNRQRNRRIELLLALPKPPRTPASVLGPNVLSSR